jgi:type I restriction enzyme M protein
MNLRELLTQLDTPIVIRPTRRMTQGALETYLDKAADILRGNADHSEFRGYVFALLFYKRISDCYDEKVSTQTVALVKAGVPLLHARMSDAWQHVPGWAQRGTGTLR